MAGYLFNLFVQIVTRSRWSRTSARTVPWTRTSPSGTFHRSAFSSSLRTTISRGASWKYDAAPPYTTFTGRAPRSAPRRTNRGWYTTNQRRPSSVSTTYSRHPTSRPARRNPMDTLESKVKQIFAFSFAEPLGWQPSDRQVILSLGGSCQSDINSAALFR